MSKPFAILVAERSRLPADVLAKQAMERMARWSQISAGKLVSLDEVAWLGAILDVGFRTAIEQVERKKVEQSVKSQLEAQAAQRAVITDRGKVHTVVLTDGVKVQDGVL